MGEKQAELQAVLNKLAALDTDLADKVARKETLEAEVEMCKVKLDRCGLSPGPLACLFAGTTFSCLHGRRPHASTVCWLTQHSGAT